MQDAGCRELAAAVIARAIVDARSTVPGLVRDSARRFFRDGWFEGWASMAGIHPDLLRQAMDTRGRVRARRVMRRVAIP